MAVKAQTTPRYTLEIEAPANGSIRAATVLVIDADGKTRASDKANLVVAANRVKLSKSLARQLGEEDDAKWQKAVEAKWTELLDEQRRIREQAAAGSPEAASVETAHLLDMAPLAIRRPLALVAGRAYAAVWPVIQRAEHKAGAGAAIRRADDNRTSPRHRSGRWAAVRRCAVGQRQTAGRAGAERIFAGRVAPNAGA